MSGLIVGHVGSDRRACRARSSGMSGRSSGMSGTMEAEKHNFRPQHTNLCGARCGGLRRFAEACGALRTIAAHKIRMRKVAERLRKLCR